MVATCAVAAEAATEGIVTGLGEGAGPWGIERVGPTEPHSELQWSGVSWSSYNASSGEARPAACDLDGDGRDEIVLGLSQVGGAGWLEVKDDATTGHAHLAWLRIDWAPYNRSNGETFPACGDVDGDGLDEIVVGLGRGASGWLRVFDDALAGYSPLAWLRVGWGSYNASNGETFPAVGNLDDDPEDEVVLGLGSGGSGWAQVLDDANRGFQPLQGTPHGGGWLRLNWSAYNAGAGITRPAVCDVDGDGGGELILGLGPGGGGWLEVLSGKQGGFGHIAWPQVAWSSYNAPNGETFPSCGDLDGDAADELVIGLGRGGSGWFEVKDDLSSGHAHVSWPRVHWSTYNDRNGLTRSTVLESATPEVNGGLLYPEDSLEYLGAFVAPRYPEGDSSWHYAGSGLTYRPNGDPGGPDDGFPGSLFATSHAHDRLVAEIAIPAPKITRDASKLPQASHLQPFTDITGGRTTGTTLTTLAFQDMQIVTAEDGEKLYWLRGAFYQPEYSDPVLGEANANFADLQAHGTWRIDSYPQAAVNGYLFEFDKPWADAHLKGRRLGVGQSRLVNGGSWGPTAYTAAPWVGSTPADGERLTSDRLLHYPDWEREVQGYGNADEVNGAAWIKVGQKRALVFAVTKAARTRASGHQYYGSPGSYGCGSKGYHGEPYYGALWFYDPKDLLAVKNGEMASWEPQPYAVWNLDPNLIQGGACRRPIFTGIAYDEANRLLYVSEAAASRDWTYDRRPVFHVFRVTEGTGIRDSGPPPPVTNLSAALNTDGKAVLSWNGVTDETTEVMYLLSREGRPVDLTFNPTVTARDIIESGVSLTYSISVVDQRGRQSKAVSVTVGNIVQ